MSIRRVTRRYVDGPFGQIHLRLWSSPRANGPLLICLAPAPYSGLAYATLAPRLTANGTVVALDYPGYGNSDATPAQPTIEDFARAVNAVADALSPEEPVALLGFHTGTLVATQAALDQPERIARTVLIDVPFFEPARRAALRDKMGAPRVLAAALSSLADDWSFSVEKRLEHVPLRRGYALFVDQISAGENRNSAFHAAFSYPCEERFARAHTPSLVVATAAGLHAPTCAAAQLMPGARLHQAPEIEVAVLEKGAPRLSELISPFLAAHVDDL